MKRPFVMEHRLIKGKAIISANYLANGAPIWWDGNAWSAQIDAVAIMEGPEAQALADELAVRDATLVVGIEVSPLTKAGAIPRRQYMRQQGPSVRSDLGGAGRHNEAA